MDTSSCEVHHSSSSKVDMPRLSPSREVLTSCKVSNFPVRALPQQPMSSPWALWIHGYKRSLAHQSSVPWSAQKMDNKELNIACLQVCMLMYVYRSPASHIMLHIDTFTTRNQRSRLQHPTNALLVASPSKWPWTPAFQCCFLPKNGTSNRRLRSTKMDQGHQATNITELKQRCLF